MLESHSLNKLRSIDRTFQELTSKLEGRSILSSPELQQIFRDIATIEEAVYTFHLWQKVSVELIEAQKILQESQNDRELQELANIELIKLDRQIINIEYRLKCLLLSKDPLDNKNVFLEITAASGSEEFAFLVNDLVRIYERYAEAQKWQIKLVTQYQNSSGGLASCILKIKGDRVYSHLKFESGIHELQRRSTIELGDKIITAIVTVNVMVEVAEGYLDPFLQDIELWHYYTLGQPRKLAMEAYHKPTGIKATCSEECNQRHNQELAWQVLGAKLYSIELQRQQEYLTCVHQDRIYLDIDLLPLMTNDSRKIRSYNYVTNRVVDLRLEQHFELDKVIGGDIDEIINGCLDRDIQERLAKLTQVATYNSSG